MNGKRNKNKRNRGNKGGGRSGKRGKEEKVRMLSSGEFANKVASQIVNMSSVRKNPFPRPRKRGPPRRPQRLERGHVHNDAHVRGEGGVSEAELNVDYLAFKHSLCCPGSPNILPFIGPDEPMEGVSGQGVKNGVNFVQATTKAVGATNDTTLDANLGTKDYVGLFMSVAVTCFSHDQGGSTTGVSTMVRPSGFSVWNLQDDSALTIEDILGNAPDDGGNAGTGLSRTYVYGTEGTGIGRRSRCYSATLELDVLAAEANIVGKYFSGTLPWNAFFSNTNTQQIPSSQITVKELLRYSTAQHSDNGRIYLHNNIVNPQMLAWYDTSASNMSAPSGSEVVSYVLIPKGALSLAVDSASSNTNYGLIGTCYSNWAVFPSFDVMTRNLVDQAEDRLESDMSTSSEVKDALITLNERANDMSHQDLRAVREDTRLDPERAPSRFFRVRKTRGNGPANAALARVVNLAMSRKAWTSGKNWFHSLTESALAAGGGLVHPSLQAIAPAFYEYLIRPVAEKVLDWSAVKLGLVEAEANPKGKRYMVDLTGLQAIIENAALLPYCMDPRVQALQKRYTEAVASMQNFMDTMGTRYVYPEVVYASPSEVAVAGNLRATWNNIQTMCTPSIRLSPEGLFILRDSTPKNLVWYTEFIVCYKK